MLFAVWVSYSEKLGNDRVTQIVDKERCTDFF